MCLPLSIILKYVNENISDNNSNVCVKRLCRGKDKSVELILTTMFLIKRRVGARPLLINSPQGGVISKVFYPLTLANEPGKIN